MKRYNFSIIIEQDSDGFFVFCPELQGCYIQGNTYEEALANIKDAIKLHLEDVISDNQELPKAKSVSLSSVEVTV